MKKAIVILGFTGLALVFVAYYFSLQSLRLIERLAEANNVKEVGVENEAIAEESAREELVYSNTFIYQYLDLDKAEYARINPCMQRFQASEELDALCLNELVDAVVDDFGEEHILKALIGSCINYENLAFDHSFPNQLFAKNNSLADKLRLGFLNRYRNPRHLQGIFDRHKAGILESIPKSLYQKVFEKKLLECLEAYQQIARQTNKEAFFKDIYFKADTQKLHDQYWNYTFWKRREIEKNDAVTYAILSEIKTHFDER
ncbi:hypothetical protein [Leeuwenhoekiella sp. H156]|uniref:hypothetical protein n=1 Tax=Leeuwenhoekiella sp. H156 TaxID=3450128 RepID=UPI003FA4966B